MNPGKYDNLPWFPPQISLDSRNFQVCWESQELYALELFDYFAVVVEIVFKKKNYGDSLCETGAA